MGLHLCLMLKQAVDQLGQNNTIYAASRFQSLNSDQAYLEAGIEVLKGDFRNEVFINQLPRCETVFYLVGAKFGTTDRPELLEEINVKVAGRLGEYYRDSHIVAFSTGCVYSYTNPEYGGSTEASPTDPVGDYAQSCLGREVQFATLSRKYGTPVALIRLNYSTEFRYGVLVDIGTRVLQGEPVDLTMGYLNLIWQPDALNHIIRCLDLAGSPAVPINITGPDILSVRDLAERFGQVFGTTPRFQGEPAESMWLSDASHSHRMFGKPVTDLEAMIQWTAAWLLKVGQTHGKPTGFEKRDGKF